MYLESTELRETIMSNSFEIENSEAEEYISQDMLPEAANILLNIIDNDSENFRAFNNLGMIAWKDQSWYDAYALFKNSVEINPAYADAVVNLFDAALKIGKIDEVKDYLVNAAKLIPEDDEVVDISRGIIEDGDDIYFCIRALSEGFYHPDIDKADKAVQAGNLNEAIIMYVDYIEKEGEAAEAYNGLGVISFYQDRAEDAFLMFFESLKLNPINKDTFLNFFDAAALTNRVEEALKVYDIYLESYPHLSILEDEVEEFRKKL
jgi:tetratricopeptide (TPR) repeat protein